MLSLAGTVCPTLAQTLARRGWAGSGITADAWWKGAIFYEVDPINFQDSNGDGFGDLRGIEDRLDYLRGLGVDALVLSPLRGEITATRRPGLFFDPRYGSEEDLDSLIAEASKRKIRVLVDLDVTAAESSQDLVAVARFWLSRGVAGFRLTRDAKGGGATALTAGQRDDRVRQLRLICASFVGQRVLLWDSPVAFRQPREVSPAAPKTARHTSRQTAPARAELIADGRLANLSLFNAATVRGVLGGRDTGSGDRGMTTVIQADSSERARSIERFGDGVHDIAIAKLVATALLATARTPLLYFGQEIGMEGKLGSSTPMQWGGSPGFSSGTPWTASGKNASSANVALEDADPDSLLNWYRELSSLRHENEALRAGSMDLLATTEPNVLAWVRSMSGRVSRIPPVLVVCNFSEKAVVVSVESELKRLGLFPSAGSIHTMAASQQLKEPARNSVMLSGIALPAHGVYLGVFEPQPGLESVVIPVKHSHARRARSSMGR